jgi:DNA ligase (NAD+)
MQDGYGLYSHRIDIHGIPGHEMFYSANYLRTASVLILTVLDRLPAFSDQRCITDRAIFWINDWRQAIFTQIIGRIEHFIHRNAMDIDSMGVQTITILHEKGLINNPADLYKLSFEDIIQLEGFQELSAQNILKGIEDSKAIPFDRVLFGLGIRYVGKTVAEKLAEHFLNIDSLMQANYNELIQVPEIGERIAYSLMEYFDDEQNQKLISALKSAGLRFSIDPSKDTVSTLLDGQKFVVSGVFESFSRDELKQTIKKNGGKILSAISQNIDFLVAGDNMGPAKKKKAEKLGVRIISEEEFVKMISN